MKVSFPLVFLWISLLVLASVESRSLFDAHEQADDAADAQGAEGAAKKAEKAAKEALKAAKKAKKEAAKAEQEEEKDESDDDDNDESNSNDQAALSNGGHVTTSDPFEDLKNEETSGEY